MGANDVIVSIVISIPNVVEVQAAVSSLLGPVSMA